MGGTVRRTGREIVEVLPLQPERFLVPKKICVVEGSLIHKLQGLGDEEHRKNGQVYLPADPCEL